MLLLLIHAAATWFLVGLIWTIQLVHYPAFNGVGGEGWADYHRRHTRNITFLVAPAMLLELATALLLAVMGPGMLTLVGLGLVVLLWLSTAAVQVPVHASLGRGFDRALHRKLVRTNWVRTALWSIRGVLALLLLGAR